MRLRLLRRRFGMQAARVAVRPHLPWYWRWCAIGCTAAAAAGLLWIAYQYGQSYATAYTPEESQHTAADAQKPPLEVADAALRSELAMAARQLQIERAAQTDLARQVKALTQENAQLKEDIAVLQAISAPGSRTDGISVSSARVEPNGVGEYVYRIVLVQTGSRAKPFQGSYQLVVTLDQGGVRGGMTIPEAADQHGGAYKLDFRVHQRIDGTFKVTPGVEVRSVQLRVYEGKQVQPKVMRTIAVS